MILKRFLLLCPIFLQTSVLGQTVFLETGDANRKLVDRLVTLSGSTGDSIHVQTGMLPLNIIARFCNNLKADNYSGLLSNADMYDVNKLVYDASEYNTLYEHELFPTVTKGTYSFYRKTPYLFEQAGKAHFVIEPRAAIYTMADKDFRFKYQAAAGLMARGRIGSRFGFHLSGTYHLEQLPDFFERQLERFDAMPNAGPYRQVSSAGMNHTYAYLQLNGQLSFDLVPRNVSINAGYGKFFIGDGIRSLILSDYSAGMPYVALRTNIWKLEYINVFMKPLSQSFDYGLQQAGENKYIALHYLSAHLTDWLNIGLFETITSSREGGVEFGYFNPVIFYRAIERQVGTPDKMAIGVTAKAVVAKTLQLYGQFFINEFTAKEFFGGNGYIHNKWGTQFGLKYFNMFRIDNLDMQVEANILRPYAYQHRSNSNYSNYNQPLAHPLGAGLQELLVNLSYRPLTRLRIDARMMAWKQGQDSTTNQNYGSDILKDIRNHPSRYGVGLIHGVPVNTSGLQLVAAYELQPNLFIELGGLYRNQTSSLADRSVKSAYGFFGIRYRIGRRDFFQF